MEKEGNLSQEQNSVQTIEQVFDRFNEYLDICITVFLDDGLEIESSLEVAGSMRE